MRCSSNSIALPSVSAFRWWSIRDHRAPAVCTELRAFISFFPGSNEEYAMRNRLLMVVLAMLAAPAAMSQDISFGEDSFTASFSIDSSYTADGMNYEVSASGEGAPAACIYLICSPTSLRWGMQGNSLAMRTQNGEALRASLQGVFRRKGPPSRCIR